jgi:protein-S-isoprenylcysteine O-methyltransferase Ste14
MSGASSPISEHKGLLVQIWPLLFLPLAVATSTGLSFLFEEAVLNVLDEYRQYCARVRRRI